MRDARQRRGAARSAVVEPRGELLGDAPQRGGRLGRQRQQLVAARWRDEDAVGAPAVGAPAVGAPGGGLLEDAVHVGAADAERGDGGAARHLAASWRAWLGLGLGLG